MIIKVCGMREAGNIQSVAGLGIDWMGFIFWSGSKRYVGEDGGGVVAAVPAGSVAKVGVFVNAALDEIKAVVALCGLDFVQLHGDEPPSLCRSLRNCGYGLIKAIPIASEGDVRRAAAYEEAVDYLLFDTRTPSFGGSGRQFDWGLLQAYGGRTPFLLSGGINPGSAGVIQGFRHERFAGIDLNSGFETAPGVKDEASLAQFIHSVRSFNQ
jgi:phosphoribosylanthranilate isomerase